ncbi:hypothetical protein D5S17_28645 [Pseudonocardiaceae bacterium YIM PH 21723]|nr:hypothetical protein D5S17_28645 [Pseudonocardiaceae bacterium YIM PH 21723]
MERERLIRTLDRDIPAYLECRDALEAYAGFKVWSDPTAAGPLSATFSRRGRLVQRRGHPGIGITRAIVDLRTYQGGTLCLGYVDDRGRLGYYFQLFLTPELDTVVACFGFRPPEAC